MADRAPLAGWRATAWDANRLYAWFGIVMARIDGDLADGFVWNLMACSGVSDLPVGAGVEQSLGAAQLAAEDAARALVADMAAALGGSVTWADAQEVSE